VKITVPATGVVDANNDIYVILGSEGFCKVSALKKHGIEEITSIRGTPCNAIGLFHDHLLISAGETLYAILLYSNEVKPILRVKPGNWFWHGVESCGGVFVQEYGEPPTGIYVSEDLRHFSRVVTNNAIDPLSRHFHY